MQVILLERVEKLGQMGEVVKVKDGFARNFLLPNKKALRATKDMFGVSWLLSRRVRIQFEEVGKQTMEARNHTSETQSV